MVQSLRLVLPAPDERKGRIQQLRSAVEVREELRSAVLERRSRCCSLPKIQQSCQVQTEQEAYLG